MNGAAGGEAGDPGAADAVQAHRQPPQEPGRRPPQIPQLHHRHRPGIKFTAVTSSSPLSSSLGEVSRLSTTQMEMPSVPFHSIRASPLPFLANVCQILQLDGEGGI